MLSAHPTPERVYHPAEVTPYYSAQVLEGAMAAIPDYSGQQQNSSRDKVLITTPEGSFVGHYPPNDYSRTWQMQRHKNRGDFMGSVNQRDLIGYERQHSNAMATNQSMSRHCGGHDGVLANQNGHNQRLVSEIDGRPIKEHIYESPKFERKCNSLDNPRNKVVSQNSVKSSLLMDRNHFNPGHVQYYELDPHNVEKRVRNGAVLQ